MIDLTREYTEEELRKAIAKDIYEAWLKSAAGKRYLKECEDDENRILYGDPNAPDIRGIMKQPKEIK